MSYRSPRLINTRTWLVLALHALFPFATSAMADESAAAPIPAASQPPSDSRGPAAPRASASGEKAAHPRVLHDGTNPYGSIGRLAIPNDWHEAEADLEKKGVKRGTPEFTYKMKMLQNVWEARDHVDSPDTPEQERRNGAFWMIKDGSYVVNPDKQCIDAINDLWKWKVSGIYCRKMAMMVLLKTRMDFATGEERTRLNELLRGKVIPDELPQEGQGMFFTMPKPKAGVNRPFENDELLPGDQVWFKNSYFERVDFSKLSDELRAVYTGEEGSNVYYMGGDKFIIFYDGYVYTGFQYKMVVACYSETVKVATGCTKLGAPNNPPRIALITAEMARLNGMEFPILTDDQLQNAFQIRRVRRPYAGPIK
jgi:hypothetical protein